MSTSLPLQMILMLLLLFYFKGASGSSNAAGDSKIRCLEVERQALLNIKDSLHEIQEGFLSSWGNEEEKRDCCEWYGVQCANNSGHVTVLDLAPSTSPIYNEYYNLRRFLHGTISPSLRELKHLTYLDLSLIDFSGHGIPSFIGTLTKLRYTNTLYQDEVELVWKGTLSKFRNTLGLVKSIDLSSNKLMGEIPTEITQLIQLVSLNLSRNNFSGRIPSEIGKLTLLDALDLSNNQLSGGIPSSLSEVDRLNVLNLSNNHLSGKIPTGTQLQSFEGSYAGNPELCGAPLLKRCPGDEPTVSTAPAAHEEEEDEDKFVTRGFYVTLGLGFVVGFWGVCGSLIFSKTWRYSYFNFLDDVNDWIYVMVAVHKAKLLRMIKN